jgi:CBS domain-containing protein
MTMASQRRKKRSVRRRGAVASGRARRPTPGHAEAVPAGVDDRRRVRDVMTPYPTCCAPGDTAERAARVMRDGRVGAVPVVQRDRRLVGIVTDRDLAVAIVAEARDAQSVTVESVMTRGPVTAHPEDELGSLVAAMAEHRVRRVPVVDAKDRIVGIVAQSDIANPRR